MKSTTKKIGISATVTTILAVGGSHILRSPEAEKTNGTPVAQVREDMRSAVRQNALPDIDPGYTEEVLVRIERTSSELVAWTREILSEEGGALDRPASPRVNVARVAFRLHILFEHLLQHLSDQASREVMGEIDEQVRHVESVVAAKPLGDEPFVGLMGVERDLEGICNQIAGGHPRYTYELPAETEGETQAAQE